MRFLSLINFAVHVLFYILFSCPFTHFYLNQQTVLPQKLTVVINRLGAEENKLETHKRLKSSWNFNVNLNSFFDISFFYVAKLKTQTCKSADDAN